MICNFTENLDQMDMLFKIQTKVIMKKYKNDWRWLNAATATLCLALIARCSTARGYKEADKTGESITTLRNDVVNIKAAVDGSMTALDGLEAAASTNPRPAYETFAKSVDKVEDA